MESTLPIERRLQELRFLEARKHFRGSSLLDFGGNKGELEKFVKQDYFFCNEDYSVLKGRKFDTIAILAVIEHLERPQVYEVIGMLKEHLNEHGRIVITTPTSNAEAILKLFVKLGLLDRENMDEHRHYWNKPELLDLAVKNGFSVKLCRPFEAGMNLLMVMEK